MDLRHRHLTAAQIEELHRFIRQQKLNYQPFIFTDTLQVGEGQRFRDGEFAEQCGDVLWEGHPPDIASRVTKDRGAFQEANADLRKIYDAFVDFIVQNVGEDVSQLSFAEFGCNAGYFLHSLALRGARKTTGYDINTTGPIFRWFNEVLGIPQERNEFRFAEWDSLEHRVRHCRFDEADVCMSIAVSCHLSDPIHHLAFLCAKARKAVFFWSPVDSRQGLSLSLGKPGKYVKDVSFPINFDNCVRFSSDLLRLTFEECGFGEQIEIELPDVSPAFQRWFKVHKGILALRTSRPATLYAGGGTQRMTPPDAPVSTVEEAPAWKNDRGRCAHLDPQTPFLVERGYRDFNIVQFQRRLIAVSHSVGAVDLASVDETWIAEKVKAGEVRVAESLDDVKRQIDHLTIEKLSESVRQLEQQPEQQLRKAPLLARFAQLRRTRIFSSAAPASAETVPAGERTR